MVAHTTWLRYIASKIDYSISLSWKEVLGCSVMSISVCRRDIALFLCFIVLSMGYNFGSFSSLSYVDVQYSPEFLTDNYRRGQITDSEVFDTAWKNLFQGKLTFLHWNKGEEMAPTVGPHGGTLLVRKIPEADPTRVYVGDVVVLKDPISTEKYLVRRLAAIEGYEMASTDEKDEPFVLEKNECWVLADNENIKPKEAYDSRTFGPVSMTDIIGRVIYCLRTAVDHGPVNNSHFSARKDLPVLEVELDVDEMAKNHKA